MSTTPHDDLVRAILSHPEHAAGELRYLRRSTPLPDDALERLRHAEPSDLERWADRVLTAATLGEVLDAP